MKGLIGQFRDDYAERFANGMSTFLGLHGQSLIRQIQEATTRPRCTVYIFGNGGSHSISRCMEYALQTYALSRGLPLRTQTGVDVHQLSLLKQDDASPGMPFVRVLEMEGADSSDLVILISGSGNSDNLCEVASYAERHSIPTLALIGSSQGKLRNFVSPAHCFFAPLDDQQISEDIIQSTAYFLNHSVSGMHEEEWNGIVSSQAKELRQAIQQIPESFISNIVKAVIDAFHNNKFIWIMGFDHPALSMCAEHTAHNFYWDSIYKVSNPPRRLIWSSPTSCNFSGISNDRRREIVPSLMGLSEDDGEGLALLYSMTLNEAALHEVVERLTFLRLPVFLLSAEGNRPPAGQGVTIHKTGLKNPQTQAGISQLLGHMLGRIIHMELMQEQGFEDQPVISDPGSFLREFDLAQRRLLNG